MGNQNDYLKYKKDIRQALLQAKLNSEEYQKSLQNSFQKQRMIMRYRLYGRDGVSEHEFNKLIQMGFVKKIGEELKDVRMKKRKQVKKTNPLSGQEEVYSTDMSGDGDSTYTVKKQYVDVYQDNEDGDPFQVNMGFKVEPLCPDIFGQQEAKKSHLKFKAIKEKL